MAGLGGIGAAKLVGYGLAGCLVVGGGGVVYLGGVPDVRFVIADPDLAVAEPETLRADVDPVGQATPVALPPAAQVPPAPEPVPGFDLVRVETDGAALIAGHGVPGKPVELTVDGVVLGTVTADGSGQFVGMFDLAATGAAQLLELRWQGAEGLEHAPDSVIIAPLQPPTPPTTPPTTQPTDQASNLGSEIAAAAKDAAPPTPAPQTPVPSVPPVPEVAAPAVDTLPSAGVTMAEAVATEAVPRPAAPQVLIANRDGAAPIAARDLPAPDRVAIDSIAYGQGDTVIVQGRSGAPGELRLSLGGATVLRSQQIDAPGGWRAELRDIAPGRYTLRADLLAGDGAVLARAEIPFLRAAPDSLPSARPGTSGADLITVQPGFTLWRIARERYGGGGQYVQVFDANRDQISDPDLIYPGQVLSLPQ